MTTTTDLRDDATFLRELAKELPAFYADQAMLGADEDTKRLEEIAAKVESVADVMFTPSQELESRVEEALAASAGTWLKIGGAQTRGIMAALWLLQRRVKAAGGKAMLGSGLAGFGAALGAAIGGGGDKKKKGH